MPFSPEDLVDTICEHLSEYLPQGTISSKGGVNLPGRKFLSEYEIRRMLTSQGSSRLKVPQRSIISPLAQEWLSERGIEIIDE